MNSYSDGRKMVAEPHHEAAQTYGLPERVAVPSLIHVT